MRRKKFNRVLILVLALILSIAFCGCGNSKEENKYKCTIEIECKTILNNMEKLDSALKDYIPSDGILLKRQTVSFCEGESVYDILKRTSKENNILMEASFTGKMAYIEGISNIYEFSCGELSGWIYYVNGESFNKSCSEYKLKDGDEIQWRYTCDLGEDLK